MAITADKNKSYGGTNVTEKYSPLRNIKFVGSVATVCGELVKHRLELLSSRNILPNQVTLRTDWESVIEAEKSTDEDHAPPLVVISSNRSKWIAAGVAVGKKQRVEEYYEGSNDLKALTGKVRGQIQSPPLYTPERTAGDRKVYIVVHALEYDQYKTALAGTGLRVVGWAISGPTWRRPAPGQKKKDPGPLTGFGASRFAAIEFCKYLRKKVAMPHCDYAWLLDDNVVGLAQFPGYEVVETAIKAGTVKPVCAGFHGASKSEDFESTKDWVKKARRAGHEKPTVLPPSIAKGLIQQAALWNIKYFADNNLNFSPCFITSGEDVSLGHYFDRTSTITYHYYNSITVHKELTTYDNSKGAEKVEAARQSYADWFAAAEAAVRETTPSVPPPPLPPVKLQFDGKPTEESLSKLITDWFNADPPHAQANAGSESVQNKVKCQAVEQIVCEAIQAGVVSAEVMDKAFKISGEAGHEVLPVQLP
jgi:hypothetical protein